MKKQGNYLAIATVTFKNENADPSSMARWRPSRTTSRICFICINKFDEQKVHREAGEWAEKRAKEMESANEGLMVVYSIKIDAIVIHDVVCMDTDGSLIKG